MRETVQGFERIEEGHFLFTKEEEKKLWVSQHVKWMQGAACLLAFVRWDICVRGLVSRGERFCCVADSRFQIAILNSSL